MEHFRGFCPPGLADALRREWGPHAVKEAEDGRFCVKFVGAERWCTMCDFVLWWDSMESFLC